MAQRGREHIAVIGSGAWGTTLSLVAAQAGNSVSLYVRDADSATRMRASRRNQHYLPDVAIPESIDITADLETACRDAALILLVVPSQTMRENIRAVAPHIGDAVVISAAKGLDRASLKRMTEVIREEIPDGPAARVCALSGPNLSSEIAAGKPATSVIAGYDLSAAELARDLLSTPLFRTYTNDDVIGVEIGGALKNVIAIGAGIADGLGAGDNAKAAFITRGLAEIARLGITLGAHPLTFAGLSGLGDLIATCASPLSRNHFVGQELAKGRSLADIRAGMSSVAEGVFTTEAACALARRAGIELPISEQIYDVLFGGKSPIAAVAHLMQRDAKDELEELRSATYPLT